MKKIKDYTLLSGFLTRNLTRRITFANQTSEMREILNQHPKLLVAMNHGPMLGPAAAIIALAALYNESGGKNRKPLAIMWRLFYKIPVWKYVIQYLTQVDHGMGFDECVEKMTNEEFTDLLVMPEGENCNFGNGIDIEPFLSPRFIEIALRLNIPILVLVHHGSEQWAETITVSRGLKNMLRILPKKDFARIEQTRRLSIPKTTRQIDELKVTYQLYEPNISLADLPDEPKQRREVLQKEAEEVRKIMQAMADKLK